MILTSDLGCSSPVGCQNPMQWFLSSFQSPCVNTYIYMLIYIYVYIWHTHMYTHILLLQCIKHLHWNHSPIFLGKKHPFEMSIKKTQSPTKTLVLHLNDLVNLELTMFLQRCGLQNNLKTIRLQPKKIIPFLNQRFPRVLRIPPETKQGGFYKASQYNSRPIVYSI